MTTYTIANLGNDKWIVVNTRDGDSCTVDGPMSTQEIRDWIEKKGLKKEDFEVAKTTKKDLENLIRPIIIKQTLKKIS